jgi:hypothetical protein
MASFEQKTGIDPIPDLTEPNPLQQSFDLHWLNNEAAWANSPFRMSPASNPFEDSRGSGAVNLLARCQGQG